MPQFLPYFVTWRQNSLSDRSHWTPSRHLRVSKDPTHNAIRQEKSSCKILEAIASGNNEPPREIIEHETNHHYVGALIELLCPSSVLAGELLIGPSTRVLNQFHGAPMPQGLAGFGGTIQTRSYGVDYGVKF